jgi:ribosomal protein L11 methyltransferase
MPTKMNYLEFSFKITPLQPFQEILIHELGEIGFESFTVEEEIVNAYIAQADFKQEALDELYLFSQEGVTLSYEQKLIPQQNWNAEWEKNFPKVVIDDYCEVIAPFHEPSAGVKHHIHIEPKMSFGTGHHDTTFMMMQLMRTLNISGKRVMDMGCGTGVLAILAYLEGAAKVSAVDIDEWAYENTIENCQRNSSESIEVIKGGAEQVNGHIFDVFIANINRNILLRDLPTYVNAMTEGADLLLSGFFTTDVEQLDKKLIELGLTKVTDKTRDNWCALHYKK